MTFKKNTFNLQHDDNNWDNDISKKKKKNDFDGT